VPAETFAPAQRRGARLRRRAVFWGAAYAYLVTMLGTTLPTPLYGLYQQRLGFSAGVLTVIFATYAAGVLTALLLFGALSDRIGRRPVLAAGLGLAVVSTAVFLSAGDLALLLVGRLLSGLAAGLVTSAATATLTELEPQQDTRRAVAGLVVFAVFGASSVAQLLLHGLRDRLAIGIGLLALPLGLLLIVLALGQRSLALFVSGAVVAGLGQGLVFMGGLATINRLAPADQRAATLSSYFVVSYLAISLPVIGVGFAAESLGLYDAALVFAIAIGALTLVTEAFTFTGATRARLGRGLPCSDGWLAAHNLWRSC
jgi:MFS family permease